MKKLIWLVLFLKSGICFSVDSPSHATIELVEIHSSAPSGSIVEVYQIAKRPSSVSLQYMCYDVNKRLIPAFNRYNDVSKKRCSKGITQDDKFTSLWHDLSLQARNSPYWPVPWSYVKLSWKEGDKWKEAVLLGQNFTTTWDGRVETASHEHEADAFKQSDIKKWPEPQISLAVKDFLNRNSLQEYTCEEVPGYEQMLWDLLYDKSSFAKESYADALVILKMQVPERLLVHPSEVIREKALWYLDHLPSNSENILKTVIHIANSDPYQAEDGSYPLREKAKEILEKLRALEAEEAAKVSEQKPAEKPDAKKKSSCEKAAP